VSLAGQLRTPLPDGGVAVSLGRVVENGARVGMLLVPGLFRFDVTPEEDTLRVTVRNLSGGDCEWRKEETPQNPGANSFTVRVGGRVAEIQVKAVRIPPDSQWHLSAQARVSAPRLAA
jgi:hypothetical protein